MREGVIIRAAVTAASFPEPLGAVVNAGAVQPANNAARCGPSWTQGWQLGRADGVPRVSGTGTSISKMER